MFLHHNHYGTLNSLVTITLQWPESKRLVINIHNSEQTLKMYLQYHFFTLCITIVTKPSVFSKISVKLRKTKLLI